MAEPEDTTRLIADAEGLIDAVDGFCEGIAFSPAEIARVFEAARKLGLPVKLVGLGEGPADLVAFDPLAFVDALLAP